MNKVQTKEPIVKHIINTIYVIIKIFSAIGILYGNLLPYSMYLLEKLMLCVSSILNDSPDSFRLFFLVQKQEASPTKCTLTCQKHQPQPWVLRQTALGGTTASQHRAGRSLTQASSWKYRRARRESLTARSSGYPYS